MTEPGSRRRPAWRFGNQIRRIQRERGVRIMVESPALCRYTLDDWRTYYERRMRRRSRSVHDLYLGFGHLQGGDILRFRFRWSDDGDWDERVYEIEIED